MAKPEIAFEEFLSEVASEYREFASGINKSLSEDGYKQKIEQKATGYFVGYLHPKTRRSILNFLFRKKALQVRIYADYCGQYLDFFEKFSPEMEKCVIKALPCKRLINPADCNPKCVTGYDFYIGENRYKKCRYNCFQFEVTAETAPILAEFINNEQNCRRAG